MAFFKRGSEKKRRQKEVPPWCYSITTRIHNSGCTDEEVRESRKQLHEDLKSCKKRLWKINLARWKRQRSYIGKKDVLR